jgi:predicted DNA-binding transcriptional regulator YafY
MRVGAHDALMHWVMRYGKEAEILEPVELREMIKEELRCTQKIYEDNRRGLPDGGARKKRNQ